MYFIGSLISGVGIDGLPTTIFVVQTGAPLLTTLSVKSGILTITWALPRSRGNQRQRSMLAMMISAARSRRGPLSALTVALVRLPVPDRPRCCWNFFTAAA